MPITMHSILSSLALLVLFCCAVLAEDATVVTDNAPGLSFSATLPNLVNTNIRGSVVASSDPSGTGVLFQVSMSGFAAEDEPFIYHIHNNPISNGNCSTAGSHLDPFLRGDSPACDAANPATCQVGDLSGKHGKINGTTFSANYVDAYVSTTEGTPAFMGNRSIVVHYSNKTIITCASFSMIANATNTSTSSTSTGSTAHTSSASTSLTSSVSGTATGSTSGGTGTSAPVSTGGATSLYVPGGVAIMALFSLLL